MRKLFTLVASMLCFFSARFTNAQNTVVDIVVNSDVHTILETAVLEADLATTLSGDGPFTVFAPTDSAFDALPEGTLDAVLADSATLASILLYHVASGSVLSTDLTDSMMITTLQGQNVLVSITDTGIFINNAQVTMADITADNGVVHVIDAVLLPETEPQSSIVDIIVESDIHNVLETAVVEAGLVDALNGDGPFTVFAPTDDAFSVIPTDVLDALLVNPEALTNILTYHVASGSVASTDLMDGMAITTLQGQDVIVTINDMGVFINDAQVTMADIEGSNGIVHVIDAVLMPAEDTSTIVDVVVNSDVHNTLETAVIEAGLVETLSGEGPFTLFAPTDDAFNALPEGTLDAVLADQDLLTSILTYHVVGSTVLSTDLSDGMTATTLQGQDITVSISDTGIFINDAQVVMADIETSNGVVHVIDAVLLPAEDTTTSTNNLDINALGFNFGPNPVVEEALVSFNIEQPSYLSLQVSDISGRVIATVIDRDKVQGNQQFRINVADWVAGSYFLRVQVNDRIGSYRFLKQ